MLPLEFIAKSPITLGYILNNNKEFKESINAFELIEGIFPILKNIQGEEELFTLLEISQFLVKYPEYHRLYFFCHRVMEDAYSKGEDPKLAKVSLIQVHEHLGNIQNIELISTFISDREKFNELYQELEKSDSDQSFEEHKSLMIDLYNQGKPDEEYYKQLEIDFNNLLNHYNSHDSEYTDVPLSLKYSLLNNQEIFLIHKKLFLDLVRLVKQESIGVLRLFKYHKFGDRVAVAFICYLSTLWTNLYRFQNSENELGSFYNICNDIAQLKPPSSKYIQNLFINLYSHLNEDEKLKILNYDDEGYSDFFFEHSLEFFQIIDCPSKSYRFFTFKTIMLQDDFVFLNYLIENKKMPVELINLELSLYLLCTYPKQIYVRILQPLLQSNYLTIKSAVWRQPDPDWPYSIFLSIVELLNSIDVPIFEITAYTDGGSISPEREFKDFMNTLVEDCDDPGSKLLLLSLLENLVKTKPISSLSDVIHYFGSFTFQYELSHKAFLYTLYCQPKNTDCRWLKLLNDISPMPHKYKNQIHMAFYQKSPEIAEFFLELDDPPFSALYEQANFQFIDGDIEDLKLSIGHKGSIGSISGPLVSNFNKINTNEIFSSYRTIDQFELEKDKNRTNLLECYNKFHLTDCFKYITKNFLKKKSTGHDDVNSQILLFKSQYHLEDAIKQQSDIDKSEKAALQLIKQIEKKQKSKKSKKSKKSVNNNSNNNIPKSPKLNQSGSNTKEIVNKNSTNNETLTPTKTPNNNINNNEQNNNKNLETPTKPTNIINNEQNNNNNTIETKPNDKIEYDVKVGKFQFSRSDSNILGRGSNGTVVYKGLWSERIPVAIKQMMKSFNPFISKEVEVLMKLTSENCPNIVRYIDKEDDGVFVYLGLTLCGKSLADLVEKKELDQFLTFNNSVVDIKLKSLIKDLLFGIKLLHDNDIVHNDLNPRNILTKDGIFLISDLGLSKMEVETSYSFTMHTPSGQDGYHPIEVITSSRKTKSVDIFSIGCIIYYLCTGGEHPFGDKFDRVYNIRRGLSDLELIKDNIFLYDLVLNMIQKESNDRININQAISHPYFWNVDDKVKFINHCHLAVKNPTFKSQLTDKYLNQDKNNKQFLTKPWNKAVDSKIIESLTIKPDGTKINYNYDQMRDLIRAIRNILHHNQDIKLSPSIQSSPPTLQILQSHETIINYFELKFKNLLHYLYLKFKIIKV